MTSLLYSSGFLRDEQLLIAKLKGAGGRGGGTLISKASTKGAYLRGSRNSEAHGEYLI